MENNKYLIDKNKEEWVEEWKNEEKEEIWGKPCKGRVGVGRRESQ